MPHVGLDVDHARGTQVFSTRPQNRIRFHASGALAFVAGVVLLAYGYVCPIRQVFRSLFSRWSSPPLFYNDVYWHGMGGFKGKGRGPLPQATAAPCPMKPKSVWKTNYYYYEFVIKRWSLSPVH